MDIERTEHTDTHHFRVGARITATGVNDDRSKQRQQWEDKRTCTPTPKLLKTATPLWVTTDGRDEPTVSSHLSVVGPTMVPLYRKVSHFEVVDMHSCRSIPQTTLTAAGHH